MEPEVKLGKTNDFLLYFNKSFSTTYGYSPEELIGNPVSIVRSDKNDSAVTKQFLSKT